MANKYPAWLTKQLSEAGKRGAAVTNANMSAAAKRRRARAGALAMHAKRRAKD